ncbi:MAG: three-Cys-motif partner protein TcmP [Chromatiaceae bacterium]|nr:three-Cys-motif partner protein TcmP [Chromatiaceae bacterium]
MNKEKYVWRVGAPPPLLNQHSRIKHRIIESYVREYILTLLSDARIPRLQLTLVDGFAGGGAYLAEDGSGEVDGSPLLMMRAVREARAQLNLGRRVPREVAVDFEFVEDDPDAVAYLRDRITARADENAIEFVDKARVRVTNGRIQSEISRILGAVKQRKLGERVIFLLDQYGYSFPIPRVAELLRTLHGAEILLNFNVGSLITFLADRAANRKPLKKNGLDSYIPWEELPSIKANRRWRQILQRHLALGIRRVAGARFATLFFVRPNSDSPWDYWLIHLSNHYKAHEVMKDLHWANASVFGHELEPGVFMQGYDAKSDDDYTGQASFDFGDTSRDACIEGIHEHFGKVIFKLEQPTKLRELIEHCASRSPGSTQHFCQGLRRLHQSKDVIILTKDGKVRQPSKNYPLDCFVEPSKTLRLFP